MEGDIGLEFQSKHDHAGNPEEKNVERRDQDGGRVVALQFRSVVGPSQGGKRPKARAELGIEDVLVLT
jgi:hypothetical protein